MNHIEMMQFLLGSIGDMLDADYSDPTQEQKSIVVSWINRGHKNVKTTVHVDPTFTQYLAGIHENDYDRYISVFEQIEDLISVKGFNQTAADDTWFISKEILEVEMDKINSGNFLNGLAEEQLIAGILTWLPQFHLVTMDPSYPNQNSITIGRMKGDGTTAIVNVTFDECLLDRIHEAIAVQDERRVGSYLEIVEDHVLSLAANDILKSWHLSGDLLPQQ